ncbi:Pept-C1 domain-containing protein [Aphelenchoides besseyi]|nr:Pept-C1 domain-containing protein [Aphelenchoides besseyi]KAI6223830.1 Pept-C1 domain-containing protein [Aphelenchoides besseyi]
MQSASLFFLVVGVSLSLALPAVKSPSGLKGQELVDQINKQGQWKAALHPRFAGKSLDEIRWHLGAIKKPRPKHLPENFKNSNADLPASFDSRTNWPKCADIIGYIYDQSGCSNCWAVSSAATMSDLMCIKSNGTNKTPVSAIDLTSCCTECGNGCQGGDTAEAFDYWFRNGIVSGSDYYRDSYCKPYPLAPCEHTNKTTYQPCSNVVDTPKCTKSCQKGFKNSYQQDKMYSENVFVTYDNVEEIQRLIMDHGSVVFSFIVYEDFVYYQSGVYQHTGDDDMIGAHAVRGIGWGTEDGVDYWLLANQWNSDWGDNGLVKFIRGVDNCGIESYVVTGAAKV